MKVSVKVGYILVVVALLMSAASAGADDSQTRIISVMVYQGKTVLISEAAPEPQTLLTASVLREAQVEKLQFSVEVKIRLGHDRLVVYTEMDEIIWELTPRIVGESIARGYIIDTDSYRDNIALTLIGKPPSEEEFTTIQVISVQDQAINSLLTVRIQTRAPTVVEQLQLQAQPLHPYLPFAIPAAVIALGAILWRRRRGPVEGG